MPGRKCPVCTHPAVKEINETSVKDVPQNYWVIKVIRNEKGASNIMSLVFISWFIIMLLTGGIDIFGAITRYFYVDNIMHSANERAKDLGGYTQEVWEYITNELHGANLYHEEKDQQGNVVGIRSAVDFVSFSPDLRDTLGHEVDYDEMAQRGEPIHLHVIVRYKLRSFRPIFVTDEMLTTNWSIKKSGISRRFIRPQVTF